MKFHKTSLLLAVILALVGMAALATDYTWTGAKSNALDDGENWSGGVVPGDGDVATVTVSGSDPVTFTVETDTFAPWKINFKSETGATAPVCVDLCKHTVSMAGTKDARGAFSVKVPSFTIKNGVWKGDNWIVYWGVGDRTTTFEFTIEDATFDLPWGNWAWSNTAYAGGVLKLKNAKANYVPYFQENLTLLCENSTFKGMVPNSPAYGTNFFWHVTSHSVVTNGNSGGSAQNAHVVIDGESTLDIDGNLDVGSKNGKAHDNILAISNATVKVAYITVAGTNDVAYFHDVNFISRATWHPMYLNGVSNKVYFSGTLPMYNRRPTSLGLGTYFEVGEGCVLSNGEMKLSAAKDVTIKVCKDALFRTGDFVTKDGDAVLSGSKLLVEKGAVVSLDAMNGTLGLNGSNNVIATQGSVLVDKIADLAMYGPTDGCRLELLGDEAQFVSGVNIGGSSGHLNIGSTDYPNALTLKFQPGPTGFGGVAPLRPFSSYVLRKCTLNDAIIEVDAREYYAALPARNAAYRLPLINGGYSLTIADFDDIKAKAVLKPAGELVQEGKNLYYEFYKKPGLLILLR